MSEQLREAETEFDKGNLDQCCLILNQIIADDHYNTQALMLRAKVNYNWQKWGDALNDLNRILEVDPEHQLAKNYKQMVLNILTYWNKDNYNP